MGFVAEGGRILLIAGLYESKGSVRIAILDNPPDGNRSLLLDVHY